MRNAAPERGFLIAPSILSCDVLSLESQIRSVEVAGADWLHVDIMDGHFVPSLTFGPGFVEALNRLTRLPLDVHLMVEEPERWVQPFATAGASVVSFHVEATRHPRRLCQFVRSLGVKVGVALNPATGPEVLRYLAPDTDLVLVMSVDPGFAGQAFLPETLPKLAEVRRSLEPCNRAAPTAAAAVAVEVDGGVGPENARALVLAGASVLVAGNSIFGQADPGLAVGALRHSVGSGPLA